MTQIITDPNQDSYDPQFFPSLFEIEDRHFWFRVRNKVITALVSKFMPEGIQGIKLLEIGCGTGNVLQHLEKKLTGCHIFGMDLFRDGLHFASQRVKCGLVHADLNDPPFAHSFDIIGAFDVLEHISDDHGVLRIIHQLLKERGLLILTLPAYPSLWSYFDEASHHVRRYTKAELERKLRQNGFHPIFISYYMATTLPLVWMQRKIGRKKEDKSEKDQQAAQDLRIIPIINDILGFLLNLEVDWLRSGHHLPLGTSLIAVAEKKRSD